MAAKKGLGIKIEPVMLEELERFSEKTHRSIPDIIRAAIKLLLQDGYAAAEARLTRELQDTPFTHDSVAAQSGSTSAADEAEARRIRDNLRREVGKAKPERRRASG